MPSYLLERSIVARRACFNIFFTHIEFKGSGVYGAKGGYLQAGGPAAEAQ